jgi:hypothetical protein
MQGRESMQEAIKNKSEVVQLLSKISEEYESAQRGLSGLAYGMSKHDFVTARMQRMGHLHNQLQSIVGESAIALIADTLSKCQ